MIENVSRLFSTIGFPLDPFARSMRAEFQLLSLPSHTCGDESRGKKTEGVVATFERTLVPIAITRPQADGKDWMKRLLSSNALQIVANSCNLSSRHGKIETKTVTLSHLHSMAAQKQTENKMSFTESAVMLSSRG